MSKHHLEERIARLERIIGQVDVNGMRKSFVELKDRVTALENLGASVLVTAAQQINGKIEQFDHQRIEPLEERLAWLWNDKQPQVPGVVSEHNPYDVKPTGFKVDPTIKTASVWKPIATAPKESESVYLFRVPGQSIAPIVGYWSDLYCGWKNVWTHYPVPSDFTEWAPIPE